jgi:phospholipid transport system substrate-binding protein
MSFSYKRVQQIIITLLLLCISSVVSAQTSTLIDKKNPYTMIKGAADLAFKRFAREQEQIQKNPNILKTIVREELLPYIDYKYAAYKVMGNDVLRKSKTAERREFVAVFRDYLVTQYAQVFTRYKKQKVQFEEPKDFSNKKILAIRTLILDPKLGEIDISFKVRRNKRTKEWKAFDLIAEGISLLDSKRAELSSIIQQKGLSYVSKLLKEKSLRDIKLEDQKNSKKIKTTVKSSE